MRNRITVLIPVVLCILASSVYGKTLTVTNLSDSGEGSLRQAIADVADGDTINFGVTGQITTESRLYIDKAITIDGPGANALTVSRDGSAEYFSVFYFDAGSKAVLNGVSVTNGQSDFGGGVYNAGTLSITNSTISGNTGQGGGVYNGGNLSIIDSTISKNFAGAGGWFVDRNGGGIYNDGKLSIVKSTITENTLYCFGSGGGIQNQGSISIADSTISNNRSGACFGSGGITNYGGTVVITRSTISGNSASDWYTVGGGIQSYGGYLSVSNSTITGNSSDAFGGVYAFGTVIIESTTISGNTSLFGGAEVTVSGDASISNSIITGSCSGVNAINSLISDGSCGATYTGDPKLGPLADNGGPTFTLALAGDSSAIDKAGVCTGTDQRGITRPQGGACDLGAYEYVPPTIQGLIAAIQKYLTTGQITNSGLGNALISELGNAERNGNNFILNAFIREVRAQSGKAIKETAASALLADATYLVNH